MFMFKTSSLMNVVLKHDTSDSDGDRLFWSFKVCNISWVSQLLQVHGSLLWMYLYRYIVCVSTGWWQSHNMEHDGQVNKTLLCIRLRELKKRIFCVQNLWAAAKVMYLYIFFTSSWLESEVCSTFVCFWCVCGWSRKYPYYIVFKSFSMNESYIVWCFMMLIQIIIMLISYFE